MSQCTEKGVYHLIGVIAASLASTGFSPEDSYDAFDLDEDGKVSLPELQNALEQFGIGDERQDESADTLRQGRGGYKSRSWADGPQPQALAAARLSRLP